MREKELRRRIRTKIRHPRHVLIDYCHFFRIRGLLIATNRDPNQFHDEVLPQHNNSGDIHEGFLANERTLEKGLLGGCQAVLLGKHRMENDLIQIEKDSVSEKRKPV